jgi:uncharacterized protein YkwD
MICKFFKKRKEKKESKYTPINDYDDWGDIEQNILYFINEERFDNRLPPLVADFEIKNQAHGRAIRLKLLGKLDGHRGFRYVKPYLKDVLGFKSPAEILAIEKTDAESVVDRWMSSPRHRKVILTRHYKYFGVGMAGSSVGTFYCGILAR